MKGGVVGFVALLVITPAILFVSAGTAAWPMGWAYVAVVVVGSGATHLLIARKDPVLLRERARGFKGEGTQRWDRWLAPAVVWGPVVVMVVAGLDYRFDWSSVGSLLLQRLALAVAVVGYGVGAWAMLENRFFVAVARIQAERGQTVVDTGPYRWVRHPGYAASLVATLSIPLVLDSTWAFVPAGLTAVALVTRTALEDRMLRDGLAGYLDYAERTRARLVPGVW